MLIEYIIIQHVKFLIGHYTFNGKTKLISKAIENTFGLCCSYILV